MLMIMVLNSKKCSTMRKFITTMLIAAAAFTACVQNDEVVVPNNDKVSFNIAFNSPQTRTVLVEEDGKFHAEWKAGDVFEIFQIVDVAYLASSKERKYHSSKSAISADGISATEAIEFDAYTANTYRYLFTTTDATCNNAATYIALVLPATQAPSAMNTFDGASDMIVSKTVDRTSQPSNETITFDNYRISAIAKVTIKNLALAAGDEVKSVKFVRETEGKYLAGKLTSFTWDNINAGTPFAGCSESDTSNAVTVTLPEAQTGDFSYYMNVWPVTLEAGEAYSVVVTTKNDSYIKTGTIPANKPLSFTMGDITTLTVNMAGVVAESLKNPAVEMPDYVTVAGIKWAMGNLEYEKDGATDEGFAAGWRIAPSQEHHFNMDVTGTANLTDYNKVAHFNFGGIADYASLKADSAVQIEGSSALDFSGKMFTDATCTTPTTSWAEAKYGDIAYWASQGQYRMPKATEFDTLFANAKYTIATYNNITGVYFCDPETGENPGLVEGETKDLTVDDLKKGLFLPCTGRAYNNTEYKIYKVGTQAIYRTSTVDAHSQDGNGYGTIYYVYKEGEIETQAFFNDGLRPSGNNAGTYNYGSMARYSIRPIYNK